MSPFAHLCRECLDVPSNQCGYRHCPVRLGSAAHGTPGSQLANVDATRAVVPSAVAGPAGGPPAVASAGGNRDDALATRYGGFSVQLPQASVPSVPVASAAAAGDALQTRYVDVVRSVAVPPSSAPVRSSSVPAVPDSLGSAAGVHAANSDGLATRAISLPTEPKR
ncbi:MAG: hypothetical protein EXR77_16180 [Myxococcales bacterium]|nr:hypothetical protein [Myxococcales bacterium]